MKTTPQTTMIKVMVRRRENECCCARPCIRVDISTTTFSVTAHARFVGARS
jgi:hypothetical protein